MITIHDKIRMNILSKQFFTICLVFTLLIFSIGCKENSDENHHDHHGNSHILPAGDAPNGSISELEGVWNKADGGKFQWKEQKGKIFLLSMFYASCQSICPRIIADVNQIAKKLESQTDKKVNVIMVTFDPVNDTEEVLSKYKIKHNLGDNWTFLRGSEEDVRTLSVALGVNYKQTSNGEFNHSAIVSLISKDGFIVSRVEGVGANTDNLIDKYKELK